MYRSDHFTNATAPDKDSLELWVSFTWLASHTERIEFGPMVTPVSFRDLVFTARIASQVDDLSGGRLILGVGAGWQEREHTKFGYDLLDVPGRFSRFEEGLEVITRLLHSNEPVDFSGDFYRLQEAQLLPRPQRPGGPPILIGGNGPKRTLPLVAQYATEWNGVFITKGRFAELNATLDELLEAKNRQPGDVRRSLMHVVHFGRDEAEVQNAPPPYGQPLPDLRERGAFVGTAPEIVDQLGAFAEVGVQRVMLQWLELDDLDRLEAMAQGILGQL